MPVNYTHVASLTVQIQYIKHKSSFGSLVALKDIKRENCELQTPDINTDFSKRCGQTVYLQDAILN